MNNLLTGNGFNIEFDKVNYTSTSIINRGLKNISKPTINANLYLGVEKIIEICKNYAKKIFDIKDSILTIYPWINDEIEDINLFYSVYSKDTVNKLGYEDLFFVLHIMFHLERVPANDREVVIDKLRFFLLDSIYNEGSLIKIYRLYSKKLIDHINSYDKIFTTNYDDNIDMVYTKKVMHLHGCFNDILEKYNNKSKINQELKITSPLTAKNSHIFSTALSSFSGAQKTKMIKQPNDINSVFPILVKMKQQYGDIPCEPLNKLEKAFEKHQDYKYPDFFNFKDFENMHGQLTIVGLSPFNDTHIFEAIKKNKNVEKIDYYYFNLNDFNETKRILECSNDRIRFKNVKDEFWKLYK